MTAEQAHHTNSAKVAIRLARVMREAGVSSGAARLGGSGGVTDAQIEAEKNARWAVAQKAGCGSQYIPSDMTWECACKMLEVAE